MFPGEAIEGETPLDSRDGLRDRSILSRKQLSVAEAQNNELAITKYLSKRPSRRVARFDFSWLLKFHKEMFGKVWSWAGAIRRCDLTLGIPWQNVGAQLSTLVDDLHYWEKHWPDFLEQAVHLHHRAVHIHPFRNGNGRWSRTLSNIWLKLHDQPIVHWPSVMGGETSPVRKEYISCIKAADGGDISPLYKLHARFLR